MLEALLLLSPSPLLKAANNSRNPTRKGSKRYARNNYISVGAFTTWRRWKMMDSIMGQIYQMSDLYRDLAFQKLYPETENSTAELSDSFIRTIYPHARLIALQSFNLADPASQTRVALAISSYLKRLLAVKTTRKPYSSSGGPTGTFWESDEYQGTRRHPSSKRPGSGITGAPRKKRTRYESCLSFCEKKKTIPRGKWGDSKIAFKVELVQEYQNQKVELLSDLLLYSIPLSGVPGSVRTQGNGGGASFCLSASANKVQAQRVLVR